MPARRTGSAKVPVHILVVVSYPTEGQHLAALSLVRDGARDCLSDAEDPELALARVEAAIR